MAFSTFVRLNPLFGPPMPNTCNCHNPPGGQVTCESHQMAICIVRNGVAQYKCLDPPGTSPFHRFVRSLTLRGPVTSAELLNWALGKILGSHRGAVAKAQFHILLDDKYERRDGTVVTFSLPESIRSALTDSGATALTESRYLHG